MAIASAGLMVARLKQRVYKAGRVRVQSSPALSLPLRLTLHASYDSSLTPLNSSINGLHQLDLQVPVVDRYRRGGRRGGRVARGRRRGGRVQLDRGLRRRVKIFITIRYSTLQATLQPHHRPF
ncbi:hypothetical protein EXIGLDRAFT_720505 [Exidia glandulosa HHB12029]|uniref:Uncharacterized protein n=1 Tax=Exidia glandulosa HHB12029 TaxID=1314781 RepID=A0A165GDC9_EXIGL|nr:hypothetical protein EXIGLDRAFT_720505 [Exidia glandulosa HHB12029]